MQSDRDRAIADFVKRRWDLSKGERSKAENLWKTCLKAYLQEYTPEEEEYLAETRCKAYMPLAQEIADTLRGSIMSALFPPEQRYFRIRDITQKAPIEKIQKLEDFFERYLLRMHFERSIDRAMQNTVVLGNSCAVIGWKTKTRKYTVNNKEKEIVLYDTPVVHSVTPFNVVPLNPYSVGISPDDSYIMLDTKMFEEILENKDFYNINITELKVALAPKNNSTNEVSPNANQGVIPTRDMEERMASEGIVISNERTIPLLIARGDFSFAGVAYKDYIAVVANDTILIHFAPDTIGRDIYWGIFNPMFETYIGRGAIAPVRGIQWLYNVFHCLQADALSLIVGGVYKFFYDGVFDPEKYQTLVPGFVEVGDMNNLQPLAPPPAVLSSTPFTEIGQLRTESQLSAGVSEFLMGSTSRVQGRRTRYEAQLIDEGTVGRAYSVLRYVVSDFIEPLLNGLFTTLLFAKLGTEIQEEDILNYSFYVDFQGARLPATKAKELNSFMTFVELLKGLPASEKLDPNKLVDSALYLLGMRSSDVFTSTSEVESNIPEELPPEEQIPTTGEQL